MAMRVKPAKDNTKKLDVFLMIRKRIAEVLRQDGIEVAPGVSSLQLAIGTFAPSEILKGFVVSDFPFIGSRYVSLRDGHVYIVAGATDDGSEVLAYRLGFWRSIFTHRGGMAVGISEDAWMDSVMVMFSLDHASFEWNGAGELLNIYDEAPTRRSFPVKKLKAYLASWKRRFAGSSTRGLRGA